VSADDEAAQPGSHAANQDKTEPMPPTQGHADPEAAAEPSRVETPDLASMNVGVNDPQAPSRDGAAGATAQPSLSDVPAEQSAARSEGVAYRAPGSMGGTGADEQIETDVARSAHNATPAGTPGAASGPGDAADVPVVSAYPAEGTSEESPIAQGSRTPQ
jgi:hypothetical protein